jgi:hypothetical protein
LTIAPSRARFQFRNSHPFAHFRDDPEKESALIAFGKDTTRTILCFAALTVLLLAAGCGPVRYAKEDLSRLGAKEVSGVIVKPSHGSFVLKSDAGVEETYRTQQKTQYIPEDYRSLEGDRVRVAYQEIMERTGRAKLAVLQLEALEIPAKNRPAPSPVTGTVTYADTRNYIHVRPDGAPGTSEPLVLLFRSASSVLEDKTATPPISGVPTLAVWERLPVGTRVWVDFVREPILRGNGYYYRIKTIRKI